MPRRLGSALSLMLVLGLSACGGGAGDGGAGGGATQAEAGRLLPSSDGIATEYLLPDSLFNWVKSSVSPVRTIYAEANDDFADLAGFGAAVGDARIVSLTEDTHGDANAYELMNRQVQYLHQKKGFEVLIMESAMFDTEAVWRSATDKGGKVIDLAPGRLFFMYSKEPSARKVLSYVDQQRSGPNPLLLAGFDEPAGGVSSMNELLPALTQFLTARGSVLPADSGWANFASVANMAAALTITQKTNTTNFFAMARRIQAEICPAVAPVSTNLRNDPSWWCLQVNGLVAAAQRLPTIALTGRPPSKDPREAQMGANALWLVQQLYPNKKIIFWSNSTHGLRRYADRCVVEQTPCGPSEVSVPVSAISMAAETLGKSIFVVKNTALAGWLTDYTGGDNWPVFNFPDNGLLTLSQLGIKQAFVPAPADPILRARFAYMAVTKPYPSKASMPETLAREMDGMFVYPNSSPAVKTDYPVVPLP
ncbi:erythromycin esterase family protein [Chitinibacter sp. ZOR0017]|uniref:erythromycin esterase family protein n=1 Tax=Chitinibacter sp. ZOR0017 TaxID=1339254 RepID=UPI0009E03DA6|nr:erythromycin esterase family protein [Chitinibacter sp. ZOR0017]